jgi:hypothetical protein
MAYVAPWPKMAHPKPRLAELWYETFPCERKALKRLAALQKGGAEKWWPIIRELGLKAE